jgi:hypothetical protein
MSLLYTCTTLLLQDELAVLKGLATDNSCGNTDRIKNLMKHLYEKYPPMNTAHTAGDTSDDNLKKTQLATIMHYHSDKQVCSLSVCLLIFTVHYVCTALCTLMIALLALVEHC